jgi:serine/threonine-protein kinase
MEEAQQSTIGRAAAATTAGLVLLVLAAAGVMARNNLRSGRGDRDGAARLALAVLGIAVAGWVVGAHHVGDVAQEVDQFFIARARAQFQAGIIWVAYLALEPVVRRRWPTGIIGWTRLMAGRWRDPLVGRDVLIGLVAGLAFTLAVRAAWTLLTWMGVAPGAPTRMNVEGLTGVPVLLGLLLSAIANVLTTALVVVLLFVVLRLVVRWPPLAFALSTVVLALLLGAEFIAGEKPVLEVAFALAVAAMVAGVAWRFGLLALASMLLVNQVIFAGPLVPDFGAWYAPQAFVVIGGLTALAVAAFVVSRAGQPLFGRRILEP